MQTKKNTTLQLKRNRLKRQLKELEESIRQIEIELSHVQNVSIPSGMSLSFESSWSIRPSDREF